MRGGFSRAECALRVGCVLLCCLWGFATAGASAAESQHEAKLRELRSAVEEARFDEAAGRAEALLGRGDLDARTRNEALELQAIVQIAARHEARAQHSLALLYARDPDHPRRVRDLGPVVEAAFARAQSSGVSTVPVQLVAVLGADAHGRAVVRARVTQGADAVDSVHVFAKTEAEPHYTHVESSVFGAEELAITLPALAPTTTRVQFYVEARAPSGHRLSLLGNEATPLESRLPAQPRAQAACSDARAKPLRREWWLWTSVSVAFASIVVGSAVAAQ